MSENETVEIDRDTQVAVLRQELRNGRNGKARNTSQDPFGDDHATDHPARSSVQTSRRDNRKNSRDRRTATSDHASTQDKPQRVGPGGRRSSNNGSSSTSGSTETTTTPNSGLERLDAIPARNFTEDLPPLPPENEKSPGKVRAEKAVDAAVKVKKSFFKTGKVLTETEAKEYLEPLANALQDYGEYTDRLIAYRIQEPAIPPVWGDLTPLEAMVLARLMIRRAQKNAGAAGVVRNIIDGTDYISAAIIVVPRIMKTAETLKKSPHAIRKGGK